MGYCKRSRTDCQNVIPCPAGIVYLHVDATVYRNMRFSRGGKKSDRVDEAPIMSGGKMRSAFVGGEVVSTKMGWPDHLTLGF